MQDRTLHCQHQTMQFMLCRTFCSCSAMASGIMRCQYSRSFLAGDICTTQQEAQLHQLSQS